jgi:hypothetical protein
MKDKLINELQERFTGHEVEVDPGLWEAISGKLAATGADGLQDVLRDKFMGHEVPVDAHVWANISSQLGHGAAAGGSAATWLAGGLAAAAVVGGLAWWLVTGEQPARVGAKVTTEQVASVQATVAPTLAPEESERTAQPGLTDAREEGPKPTGNNNATAEGSVNPVPNPSPERIPDPEGERTVQTVLGALVEHNAATPCPPYHSPCHRTRRPAIGPTRAHRRRTWLFP